MPTENRSSNTEMVSVPFQREDRYIVVKRSDLAKVPVAYRSALVEPLFHLQAHLPQRECLVIESDWPEYDPAWAAIQARVTGEPVKERVGSGQFNDDDRYLLCREELRECEDERVAATNEATDLRSQLAECEAMAAMIAEREWAEHVGTGPVSSKVEAAFTQLHNDLHEAGEKLAERDALLFESNTLLTLYRDQLVADDAEPGDIAITEQVMREIKALADNAKPSTRVERDENAAFETWARSRITPLNLRLDEIGLYHDLAAGTAHDAWQARAALDRKPS
ncbi:hypothetical protein F3J45_01045 [Pantoea sp. Ap-967]|uniref:hypothetical protein n=1 Tax=Pantoea sp. Ap-967 TaxID=2608362 RepID=UPI00141FDE66|nr:hypothetical protein [Pantoea sp. Ap-967]NIE73053.1 hypothetical protein [Pantoea sp. Ap-967]